MSGFLDKAYRARDANATRALYDDWSATYEAEVAENGYATPPRCAEALARHLPDRKAPVLDFGCGTGLSGLALRGAGFETLDGADISIEMLSRARGKGIYRHLTQIEPGARLPHTPGDYTAIAAIGVIGAGAAPIATFDLLMDGLAPGNRLLWSFNDHALEDPANEAKMRGYLDQGKARLLFQEYGPHLPARGIKSNVYVLEKT